jgi:hypothetical protein
VKATRSKSFERIKSQMAIVLGVVSLFPTDIEYSKSLVLVKREEVVSLLFIRPI